MVRGLLRISSRDILTKRYGVVSVTVYLSKANNALFLALSYKCSSLSGNLGNIGLILGIAALFKRTGIVLASACGHDSFKFWIRQSATVHGLGWVDVLFLQGLGTDDSKGVQDSVPFSGQRLVPGSPHQRMPGYIIINSKLGKMFLQERKY